MLAWGLVYKTRLLALDEDLTIFWLPAGLAWVPALLWIWPRLKVLKLEARNGRVRELYLFVAAGTMIAPTVMGQEYLSKASASISRLGEIAEITGAPLTKYYAVDRPCLRREDHQLHWSSDLTGRHNENLTFTISVVVPFCGPPGSGLADLPPAWLGLTFSRSVHAAQPDEVKERTARAFAKESEERFAAMDLDTFTYLELIGPGSSRRGFDSAIRKADPAERGHIVLRPHHDAFEERTGQSGEWALGSFGVGAVLWLFMLAIPGVHGDKLRQLAEGIPPRGGKWRAFLVPSRANFGSMSLVYVNVVVFILMVFAGLGVVGFHLEDLVNWGASSRPLLHGVGVLRLVTSQFVHGGLMHLSGNLFGLVFAGLMLESLIGGRRVLVTYLVAGTVGGLASALMHPATVTVGASGSILGLFGVLLALLIAKDERVVPARNALLVGGAIYVGLNLLLGAVSPGVDNAAHVGGLLAGFILAPLLRRADAQPPRGRTRE